MIGKEILTALAGRTTQLQPSRHASNLGAQNVCPPRRESSPPDPLHPPGGIFFMISSNHIH
jgi:hypothetical protein